jgi:hypothetical protein
VFDAIRINWFLGVLAVELWGAAWFVAYEHELRRWWRRRTMMRRWRHHDAPSRGRQPKPPRRQTRAA